MNYYEHATRTFVGKDGEEIFFQSWNVSGPRGVLVIAHGTGEHSSRYGHIIDSLKGADISIYALDHRGYGRSGGKRGHVDSFMDYVLDLKHFVDLARLQNEGAPVVLLGHGMGGVIAFKYTITFGHGLNGLVLSSPALAPYLKIPRLGASFSGILSRLAPSLSLSSGVNPEFVSRDLETVKMYRQDPLVHDRVTPRWLTEYRSACGECLNRSWELRLPLLIISGDDDHITDAKICETVYEDASSLNKSCHLFEGLYHETMNEIPEARIMVLDLVTKWIKKELSAKKGTDAAILEKKGAPLDSGKTKKALSGKTRGTTSKRSSRGK